MSAVLPISTAGSAKGTEEETNLSKKQKTYKHIYNVNPPLNTNADVKRDDLQDVANEQCETGNECFTETNIVNKTIILLNIYWRK